MQTQQTALDLVSDLLVIVADVEKMLLKLDELVYEQAPPEDDLPF